MSKSGENLLLDTSIVIASFKKIEPVLDVLELAGRLVLPIIAYGELLYGAEKSARPKFRRKELSDLRNMIEVVVVDENTAEHYSTIRRQLELVGKPIPANDLWIAATAIQHSLTLFTSDSHFESIEGLSLRKFEIIKM